jgi:hypothetical protein
MEFQVGWIWPLLICGAAFALRVWLVPQSHARSGKLTSGWIARLLRPTQVDCLPITVVTRKPVAPQQSLVLVRVWDQELVLGVQAGVPPTVLATRRGECSSNVFSASSPSTDEDSLLERHRGVRFVQTHAVGMRRRRNPAVVQRGVNSTSKLADRDKCFDRYAGPRRLRLGSAR